MRYSAWLQIQVQFLVLVQVQVQIWLHQQYWRIFVAISLWMMSCFISEIDLKMLVSHQERRPTVVLKKTKSRQNIRTLSIKSKHKK